MHSCLGVVGAAAWGELAGLQMYRMQNPNPNPSSKSVTSSPCDGTCFVVGTLVATETGYVTIENIKVGDLVWAHDPETGETALKPVVQTFRNETAEWIHVTVNGETLTCTPEHPFYVPKKGWTSAVDLRAGDILVMLNGEYVVVEQVQHELLESPETTYNFEVKDFHTYYVGEQGIFTHNMCKKAQIKNPSKSESRVWKGFKNSKNGLKTSGSGKNQRFYSWDNLHNEIEVFDRLPEQKQPNDSPPLQLWSNMWSKKFRNFGWWEGGGKVPDLAPKMQKIKPKTVRFRLYLV